MSLNFIFNSELKTSYFYAGNKKHCDYLISIVSSFEYLY
jgi:hypothetical protein